MRMCDFTIATRLVTSSLSSPVYELCVTNSRGLSMTCLSYGATITSVLAPDSNGLCEEVTICFRGDEEYRTELFGKPGPYYGCVVGRVANRIKEGRFALDGKNYQLPVNNGPNSLHGGLEGFNMKNWGWEIVTPDEHSAGFRFTYRSPDGEEGYPGTVDAEVVYLINDCNEIIMRYSAVTLDKPSLVNMTNHAYWNLSGNCTRSIKDQKLHCPSSLYLPNDETQIPLGERRPVDGTPFDFRKSAEGGTLLGTAIPEIDGGGRPGLDNTWVVEGDAEERKLSFTQSCRPTYKTYLLKHAATLIDEISGRCLRVSTTQPGVQMYSSNWLDNSPDIPETCIHRQHNALCIETQHFPDAINQPQFDSIVLYPGEMYDQVSIFSFIADK